jgi:hypothetical protein
VAKTHLIAKELFVKGKIEAAWEVAQLDEGFSATATFEAWSSFMERCIANDEAIADVNSVYHSCHY